MSNREQIQVITYDIGTTGVKTCLFEISDRIKLLKAAMESYELYILPGGGAEQNPDEWWQAMCSTTREVLENSEIAVAQIAGISFCSQMQSLVLVDESGVPVRRAMSYMDQRAAKELKEGIAHGPQIAGANIYKLLVSLKETGAVAASVKDPVWKYHWTRNNEPDIFARADKWLDVKDYLIARCTGKFIMTDDSAFATILYNIHTRQWSEKLCRMLNINMKHLPPIVDSTAMVGTITAQAAGELGLPEGTKVFGGGGDASLVGVGSGATEPGDTHIYCGTSGWVSTVVSKPTVDTSAMIAAIVGAQRGKYNYFAEMETAGKCLEWVKDHLVLDEIDVYLEKKNITQSKEAIYSSLYDYMMEQIKDVPAGSHGVIFTPWLHGNRCPFEDSNVRGMFFNIGIETGKRHMLRAVLEGICFHLRWMVEAQDKKVQTSGTIRFVGGGALAGLTCQILADTLGRRIETIKDPQNVGAVGAAIVTGVGLGTISSFDDAKKFVPAEKIYTPNSDNKPIYDKTFEIFKNLYRDNKKSFKTLNQI